MSRLWTESEDREIVRAMVTAPDVEVAYQQLWEASEHLGRPIAGCKRRVRLLAFGFAPMPKPLTYGEAALAIINHTFPRSTA